MQGTTHIILASDTLERGWEGCGVELMQVHLCLFVFKWWGGSSRTHECTLQSIPMNVLRTVPSSLDTSSTEYGAGPSYGRWVQFSFVTFGSP